MKLNNKGILDIVDSNFYDIEQLYDQLDPNSSCFVLYAFKSSNSDQKYLSM